MNIGIIGLERVEQNGRVVKVYWQASDSNGVAYAFESGTVVLQETNPSDPQFVLFENLTEKLVLEWIKPYLNLPKIKESLNQKMRDFNAPKLIAGVPENWAN